MINRARLLNTEKEEREQRQHPEWLAGVCDSSVGPERVGGGLSVELQGSQHLH